MDCKFFIKSKLYWSIWLIGLVSLVMAKIMLTLDDDSLFKLAIAYIGINFLFFIIIAFILNSIMLDYLHKKHKTIWNRVIDYSSFIGNGTFNIQEYYKFLFLELNNSDELLYCLRSVFKQVGLLVIIIFLSSPIIFLLVMLPKSMGQ